MFTAPMKQILDRLQAFGEFEVDIRFDLIRAECLLFYMVLDL